ncbi:MAG TPA: DNA-directed RNA polymerase subunit alpha, partial [Calditrichia bacterium]|nr:DNA-directed RNA polymerase subunit alpha [Calditrichia bacterium]
LNGKAELDMEIQVGKGRGYVPAEENKPLEASIGLIPIDSIFSPILNVRFNVENVRVGQRTDYEKLILEIETDGSITPDDALTFAGKIIKDHVQLFINFDFEPEEEETQEIDEEVLRVKKLMKMNVDELELSVRSHNCLKNANIKTIGDLVRLDESELLKFRNFGRKSLQEIQEILERKGLFFGMDVDKYLKGDE